MSISEIVSFDKDGRIERPSTLLGVNFPLFKKLFLSITIILVALLSFGIGRLSVAGDREPIKIEYDPNLTEWSTPSVDQTANVINAVKKGEVIASKNGVRYHYPHCAGAKQIKEENKIVFPTPAAAEAAGYTLAANCKPR
ncbi:MAG: hypothetical protein Q7S49_02050 [bacterium]|nr:hypothetical protein [bacterium]